MTEYHNRDKSDDVDAAAICGIGILVILAIAMTWWLISDAHAQSGNWRLVVQDSTPLVTGRYSTKTAARATLPTTCVEKAIRAGYYEYRCPALPLRWIIDETRINWLTLPLYSRPPAA